MSNASTHESPSTYLASERTFLAWVRTALAVLGFGLAFSKLFPGKLYGHGLSKHIAVSAIVSSLLLLINATVRYYVTIFELDLDTFQEDRAGPAILFLITLVLILVPAVLGNRKIKKARRSMRIQESSALLPTQLQDDDEDEEDDDGDTKYKEKLTRSKPPSPNEHATDDIYSSLFKNRKNSTRQSIYEDGVDRPMDDLILQKLEELVILLKEERIRKKHTKH